MGRSGKAHRKKKSAKPPDMPRRARSAYNFFFSDERHNFLRERTQGDLEDDSPMATHIAKRWRQLSKEETDKYYCMAKEDAVRYSRELHIYQEAVSKRYSSRSSAITEGSQSSPHHQKHAATVKNQVYPEGHSQDGLDSTVRGPETTTTKSELPCSQSVVSVATTNHETSLRDPDPKLAKWNNIVGGGDANFVPNSAAPSTRNNLGRSGSGVSHSPPVVPGQNKAPQAVTPRSTRMSVLQQYSILNDQQRPPLPGVGVASALPLTTAVDAPIYATSTASRTGHLNLAQIVLSPSQQLEQMREQWMPRSVPQPEEQPARTLVMNNHQWNDLALLQSLRGGREHSSTTVQPLYYSRNATMAALMMRRAGQNNDPFVQDNLIRTLQQQHQANHILRERILITRNVLLPILPRAFPVQTTAGNNSDVIVHLLSQAIEASRTQQRPPGQAIDPSEFRRHG